jgi:hypothetical protein
MARKTASACSPSLRIRFAGYSHHAKAYAYVSRALPLAAVHLLGLKFPVKVPGRNERLLSSLMGRMPDLRLIAFRGDPHA